MVINIEAPSVFGIKEGSSFVSQPTVFSSDRNKSLRQALDLSSDGTKVPQVAPLAILSACLAYQAKRPDVQEAVRDLSGADGVVVLYEGQTATFLEDVQVKDRLMCMLTITKADSTPKVNQLTATTDVYRQKGELVTTGEAVVRLVPLKPMVIGDQVPERVGVFACFPEDQIQEILATRNGGGRLDNVVLSPLLSVTEKTIREFAKGSRDFGDLHVDAEAAKRTPFKGRIVHGMVGMGVVLASLGVHVAHMEANFVLPVWRGDIIGSKVDAPKSINGNVEVLPFVVSKIVNPLDLTETPVIQGKLTASPSRG